LFTIIDITTRLIEDLDYVDTLNVTLPDYKLAVAFMTHRIQTVFLYLSASVNYQNTYQIMINTN